MVFLWTTTKYGKIWLDGEGLKQIVSKRLPKNYYCQEVSLIGNKNLLNIQIAAPDTNTEEQKSYFEKKFSDIFNLAGLTTHVNWLNVSPEENPPFIPIWKLPVFWAGIAAAFVAILNIGVKGILWSFFALIVGYLISWIFLTKDGQKQLSNITRRIRR